MRIDDIDRENFGLQVGPIRERGIKVSYDWNSDGSNDEFISIDELIAKLSEIFEIKSEGEENAIYIIRDSGYLKIELDTIDIEPNFDEIINVLNGSYLDFSMNNFELIDTLKEIEKVVLGFCLHNTDCEFFYADDLEV
jgi:hypothetical protein